MMTSDFRWFARELTGVEEVGGTVLPVDDFWALVPVFTFGVFFQLCFFFPSLALFLSKLPNGVLAGKVWPVY